MPESAKEGWGGLSEGSDIGLGSRDRAFESPHSDQKPLKSVDFRGFFFVYCGAEFAGQPLYLHSLRFVWRLLSKYGKIKQILI